jgi:aminopeptidase N
MRRSSSVLTAAILAVLALAPAARAARPVPSPGAPSLGDRLFPGLGNGGYDVLHYNLDLRYATSAPTQPLDGTVTIVARATQALSRFDLDFAGDSVGSVSVDRRSASWHREGEELIVIPRRPLRRGAPFIVRVEHFTAHPTVANPDQIATTAFFTTPDGSATAPQPNLAHDIYPCNDHPRDKASFSFRIDVPAGETAVANGDLLGRRTRHGRTVWTYLQRQPMATELTQIAVGNFDVTSRGFHDGIYVRDVTPPSLTATLLPDFATEIGHLDWMQAQVGRYPFDLYGSFVVNTELGFALETQTISLYDIPWFRDYPQGLWDPVMLHELAHMWFGDSVSPYSWSDLWQNEGHATWYEMNYAAEKGFLEDDTGVAGSFDAVMRFFYSLGDQWRAQFGPVARPIDGDLMWGPQSYYGGALVLYALRQVIGDATFRRVERAWVRRYRYGVASTHDYIRLASEISRRDLSGFMNAWLYGTSTPPMPGHPDWTVAPVDAAAAQSAARAPTIQGFERRR